MVTAGCQVAVYLKSHGSSHIIPLILSSHCLCVLSYKNICNHMCYVPLIYILYMRESVCALQSPFFHNLSSLCRLCWSVLEKGTDSPLDAGDRVLYINSCWVFASSRHGKWTYHTSLSLVFVLTLFNGHNNNLKSLIWSNCCKPL